MSVTFKDLIGQTLTSVEGAKPDSERIEFHCASGQKFVMLHYQDCCESVTVNEVIGDVSDLIGSPVLEADEASNHDDSGGGSQTWTFYKLGTVKGHVTLRWLGESNGYYSEEVSFGRLDE